MAGFKKYDPKLESLVMEAKTTWDPEIGELSAEDKQWLSHAVHERPSRASNILYERSHTGFTRIIHVTVDDVQRIYQERAAG